MTNFLSRLKITLQIGLIGGLGVAALLGLSAVDEVADSRKEASLAIMRGQVELNESLSDLQTKLLDARRAEKDFLLRRDKTYADRNAGLIADADRVMATILADEDAAAIAPQIKTAQQELKNYSAAFAALVVAETKIGLDENSGLQGALRTSVRSAEQLLSGASESPLLISQLMMRRYLTRHHANPLGNAGGDRDRSGRSVSADGAQHFRADHPPGTGHPSDDQG